MVAGGIMQPVLRELPVECLPTEIPPFLEVDVSALEIHDVIHVSDLTLPEGVKAMADATQTLVTVLPPSVEEAKPAAEAAEAAPAEGAPGEGAAPAATPEGATPEAKGKKGGKEE